MTIRRILLFIALSILPLNFARAEPVHFSITDGDYYAEISRSDHPTEIQAGFNLPAKTYVKFKMYDKADTAKTVPAEVQAKTLGQLLDKVIAQKPLPLSFDVNLNAQRDIFIQELQKRLMQPGVNWNTKTGGVKNKEKDYMLNTLNSVVAASPINKAFEARGYTLHLDNYARMLSDPKEYPAPGIVVPTDIMEMNFTASKMTQ